MAEELAEAGGAVTAGLIAREIDLARAEAPPVGHTADEPCANCGTRRQGPNCHRCGQSGHDHRTAGALVHDIAHGVCVPPIHIYRELKDAYALDRFGGSWRTAALLVIVSVTSLVYLMLLLYLGSE